MNDINNQIYNLLNTNIPFINVLSWLALGLIAGLLANILDPRPSSKGLFGSVVLGIVGALIGGFLADLAFGTGVSGFNVTSIVIATAGALLILAVRRLFVKDKGRIKTSV